MGQLNPEGKVAKITIPGKGGWVQTHSGHVECYETAGDDWLGADEEHPVGVGWDTLRGAVEALGDYDALREGTEDPLLEVPERPGHYIAYCLVVEYGPLGKILNNWPLFLDEDTGWVDPKGRRVEFWIQVGGTK